MPEKAVGSSDPDQLSTDFHGLFHKSPGQARASGGVDKMFFLFNTRKGMVKNLSAVELRSRYLKVSMKIVGATMLTVLINIWCISNAKQRVSKKYILESTPRQNFDESRLRKLRELRMTTLAWKNMGGNKTDHNFTNKDLAPILYEYEHVVLVKFDLTVLFHWAEMSLVTCSETTTMMMIKKHHEILTTTETWVLWTIS